MFLLSNLYLHFIVIVRIEHALLPYRINAFDFNFDIAVNGFISDATNKQTGGSTDLKN